MLSRQIYENWHETKHDDAHLQEFMKHLNLKPIEEFKAQSKDVGNFRKSLVERIRVVERSRLDSASRTSQQNNNAAKRRCPCGCKCVKRCFKKSEKKRTSAWKAFPVPDIATFYTLNSASVSTCHNCITYVKMVQAVLSFEMDKSGSNSDWEGLSVIGSYMWLLGFCLQHIVDDSPKSDYARDDIKLQLEEIAQTGEMMFERMEKFYKHTDRLRDDAVVTVKKLVKKWRLESSASPFAQRPEQIVLKSVEPKRRVGKGLSGLEYEHELFQENIFTLNWSPQTVMLRSPEIDWTAFGTLPAFEKIHWFNAFLQECQDKLEKAAEALTHVSDQISCIDITKLKLNDGNADNPKSHARELSLSLLGFAKSCSVDSHPPPEEVLRMTMALKDYWYSVDILNEEAYKLTHIVKETRDIVRTCYVYIDIFYKFDLPSYDFFLRRQDDDAVGASGSFLKGNLKGGKKEGSQTLTNMRRTWSKILVGQGGDRKLSDISEMLVMMDFSTSAYQKLVEMKPIGTGTMLMKLECHTIDQKDNLLSSGLVSGVDKRKSKLTMDRNL